MINWDVRLIDPGVDAKCMDQEVVWLCQALEDELNEDSTPPTCSMCDGHHSSYCPLEDPSFDDSFIPYYAQ